MSDERQETIDDIVKEIRGNAEHNHALVEVSKYLTEIADRIEAATMRERDATREKSSPVGNTAKMLEALQKIVLLTVKAGMSIRFDVACGIIASTARCALVAPPRNCDVLSDPQEALEEIHEDRCYVNNPIDERRLTVEWLFAEAKGATDGSK